MKKANQNPIHFGVFSECLSIGERMVCYIGRYSSKTLIWGKLIRFGCKNWVLCSDDAYP